jgi:ABC-type Fe3+-hydroxamate transport system substrate-binding protein
MANAKSETVISSINKQIHQAEEQINITSSHIDKAKARLESIDSKLSTLIIDGNTLFSNTALTSEIISELDIRIIADTNNVVITIGEGE